MGSRVLVVGLCLAVVFGRDMPRAQACPYCKADAAGLAATAPPPADDADSFPVMLSGGLDFASAYYFRGYLQADHGPIVQPYLNIFTAHTVNEDLIVRPYISLFNSTHFASDNRMSDMSDVMVGAVANWNGFLIDSRYAFYTTSPLMRTPVHELGAKVSFDVLSSLEDSEWNDSELLQHFTLRPFAGVYGDWIEEAGTVQAFVNVGVEPSWRFEVAGTKVGVGLPIDWGLGGNGYYFNNDGSNATLGYFSTALTASVALPVPDGYGQWFLNTSVQYLHLAADSVQTVGNDDNDVCIGKIGMSFVY
ncbi:MAG: hypothetical protein H7062_16975 [Candidatus Saccharimonas sp.]|nr:hypothetical protein [Planctomycetaceae bacterium]